MPSFDSAIAAQAEAALSAAFDEPETPAVSEPVEQENTQSETPDAGTTVDPGTTAEAPAEVDSSFEGLDLSSVDPHTAQRIREGFLRRDDYTRKTQEIAPYRSFLQEQGINDLGQLQYAVQLMTALQENPHDVYQNLGNTLGLAVAPQVPQATTEEPGPEDEDWVDLPDHIQRELAASREATRRIDAFMAEQDQQSKLNQLAQQYQTDVSAIKGLHPDYDDEDVNGVTAFALLANGNMQAGNILYEKLTDRIISRYVSRKGSVSDAVTIPVSQGHAEPIPQKIETWDDLERVANDRMAALLADE